MSSLLMNSREALGLEMDALESEPNENDGVDLGGVGQGALGGLRSGVNRVWESGVRAVGGAADFVDDQREFGATITGQELNPNQYWANVRDQADVLADSIRMDRRALEVDPDRQSWASDVAFGLFETGGLALGSAAVGGLPAAVGVTGTAYGVPGYAERIDEGMDEETALGASLIEGAGMGASVALPGSLGSVRASLAARLAERAATGASINAVAGVAQRGAMEAYLTSRGYPEQAARYKALDGAAIATDAILGGVFGAAFDDVAPASRRPPREAVDAALSVQDEIHQTVTTAPGVPLTLNAESAHAAAMTRADDAFAAGEEVDVGDAYVNTDAAEFAPHADDIDAVLADIDFAKSALRNQPRSLTDWVRAQGEIRNDRGGVVQRGGIRDDRGDIAALASDGRKGFSSLLSPHGRTLDDLALAAWENGYFPDRAERPSINEFIDALNDEASGARRRTADLQAEASALNARQVLNYYESQGLDVSLKGDALRDAVAQFVRPRVADAYEGMSTVFEDEGFSEIARDIERARDELTQRGLPPENLMFSRRDVLSDYTQKAYSRILAGAEKLARENGGRLPRGYADTLAARTGYEAASISVMLAKARNGFFVGEGADDLQARARAIAGAPPGRMSDAPVLTALLASGMRDGETPSQFLDRAVAAVNAERATRNEPETTRNSVKSMMSQLRKKRRGDMNLEAGRFSLGQAGAGLPPDLLSRNLISYFGSSAEQLFSTARVEIVGDAGELAAKLGQPVPADVKGVYNSNDGKAYLVARNISPDEAAGVLLHEVGVHMGMRDMLGEKLFARITRDLEGLKDNPLVQAAYKYVDALIQNKQMRREHRAEEALAYVVETAPDLPLVKRILAHVRQWLWRTFDGAQWLGTLAVDDIRMMAVASLRRQAALARREAGRFGESTTDWTGERLYRGGPVNAGMVFLTPDSRMASAYGDVGVYEVRGPIFNALDRLVMYQDQFDALVREARGSGARGVRYRAQDKGALTPRDQVVMFSPEDVRSINAAFDPDFSDSPNLLASTPEGREIDANDIGKRYGARVLGEGQFLFSRSWDDLERLMSDTRRPRSVGRRTPPPNIPDPETPEYDAALQEARTAQESGQRLTPMQRAILDWEKGGDLMFSLGDRDNDPARQAILDDPSLRIPTEDGGAERAADAMERAEAAQQAAQEMGKGYAAAASCAVQHGIDQAATRAFRTIAAGQGLGAALAIPGAYAVSRGLDAQMASTDFARQRADRERGMRLDERGFLDAPTQAAPNVSMEAIAAARPYNPPAEGSNDGYERLADGSIDTPYGAAKSPPAPASFMGGPEDADQ